MKSCCFSVGEIWSKRFFHVGGFALVALDGIREGEGS